jgi:hypothetical protein
MAVAISGLQAIGSIGDRGIGRHPGGETVEQFGDGSSDPLDQQIAVDRC